MSNVQALDVAAVVDYNAVEAFHIVRAPSDRKLFVVVAVDGWQNVLYTSGNEVDYDTAVLELDSMAMRIEDLKAL